MFNLSPKNDKFFELFISFSQVISEAANALHAFVKDPHGAVEKFENLRDIEHKGDDKVHKILEELNNSFITPIDREDIYVIAKSLDDVVDNVEEAAGRYMMFNVKESRDKALVLSSNIVKASKEVEQLMLEFKKLKNSNELKSRIVEINRIENDCDIIFREAMRELFNGTTKEVDIIIWKDIFETLEGAVDACEKLANVIEGVVMKHV